MNREEIYIEYRLQSIKKGIPPIGKKRFFNLIEILGDSGLFSELINL